MSIENANDYSKILAIVKTDVDLLTPELSDRMITDEYNSYLQEVQASLEQLYEKTRYIQDINVFIKNRIMSEGMICSEQIKTIENNIANTIDSYLDKSYIIKTIDLSTINKSSSLLTDRDDSVIPTCVYENNKIVMPAAIIKNSVIKNMIIDSTRECYNNNASDLLNGPYRTLYKVQSENDLTGVKETITILFEQEIDCNYIDLKKMNCSIDSIYAISSDGVQTALNIDGHYIKYIKIIGLKIILSCDIYSTETIQTSEQYKSNDFLKSENARENINEESSVKEMQDQLIDINSASYANEVNDTVDNYITQLNDITSRNNNAAAISSDQHVNTLDSDDLSLSSIISNDTTTNYIYSFGIDSLIVEERKIKTAAAAIFPIDITNCSKIELEADISTGSGVEFYTIDNNKMIPILDVNLNRIVTDEKIFYGKDTRFIIDDNQSLSIKINGNENSGVDIVDIKNTSDSNTYTVNYTAKQIDNAATSITALKIIMRYDTTLNSLPPNISRLAIRQYGGEVDWIL